MKLAGLLLLLTLVVSCGKNQTIKLDDHGSDIVRIDNELDLLKKRVTDLENGVNGLEVKLNNEVSRLDLADSDNLAQIQGELSAEVTSLMTVIAAGDQALSNELAQAIIDLNKAIKKGDKKVRRAMKKKISKLEDKILNKIDSLKDMDQRLLDKIRRANYKRQRLARKLRNFKRSQKANNRAQKALIIAEKVRAMSAEGDIISNQAVVDAAQDAALQASVLLQSSIDAAQNTEIDLLKGRVSSLESNLIILNSSLITLGNTVAIQSLTIATLQNALQNEIDDRETGDDELKSRIRRANFKRARLARAFRRFKSNQQAINSQTAGLLSDLRSDLDSLGLTVDDNMNIVGDALNTLSNLYQGLSGTVASNFNYLQQRILDLEIAISLRIDNLSISDIGGLQAALDVLSDEISSIDISSVSGLQAALDVLSLNITTINNNISNLNINDISGLQSVINNLQNQINNVSNGTCGISYTSTHTHGNYVYANVDLVCGTYVQRLKNHTRINGGN